MWHPTRPQWLILWLAFAAALLVHADDLLRVGSPATATAFIVIGAGMAVWMLSARGRA